MPHIIVEYAQQLIDDEHVLNLLQHIHHQVSESGLFDHSHIKTRAYPFQFYTQAGGQQPYIHVQTRIKSGRDSDQKKRLSNTILAAFKELEIEQSVITVEVIDMDRESYTKFSFKE